jgi:hypothetical protein
VSTRKGQNSILFLTTLGVYLGLVLAGGASPQVFAHPAATTRNFDITDEIEFKDDLDKKPDPGSDISEIDSSATSLQEKFRPLAGLLKHFRPVIDLDAVASNHYFQFNTRTESAPVDSGCFVEIGSEISRFPNLSVLHLPRASIDPHFAKDAN